MKISSLLKLDKLPYFLTLIFIVISIQFNYIIDKIFEIPIIQYEFTNGANLKYGDLHQRYFIIKNLSDNKLINNLNIQLNYIGNSNSLIESPDIDAMPPASIIQDDPKYTQNKLAWYRIPVIQPGLSYRLIYFTNTPNQEPIISFECNQSIKLLPHSLYTRVLDNHILINFILMLLLIIIAVIYMIKIKNI